MFHHISSILVYTGYYYEFIHKTSKAGEEREEIKEERIKKILDEERKRIQPVYNVKGEIIEYDNHGRHLDVEG